MHGGIDNMNRIGVLPKGVKWAPSGSSPKDMDFKNMSEDMRDRILAMFGVSRTILGTAESDTNRSTAETADYVFSKRVVKPHMMLICAVLNDRLVPRYGDDLYISFIDPVPEDKAFRVQEMQAAIPSTVTGLTFGQAVLIARKWQLAFTVGNDLLADASVQLGEWLLAMAGEALANMIDQQGFVGGTSGNPGPFQGILQVTGTNTYTLATGGTNYSKFDPVVDASNVVAQIEESVLDGSAWYMHRTVWAAIAQKEASTSGIPFLFFGAFAANQSGLEKDPLGGPIRAAGNMMGFPVYTNRWLPSYVVGTTNASTAFMIFGNMKAMAFGDKGDMRIGNFQSGTWAGKELSLSDQSGIVYKHRHALVVVLPKAFCVVSTSSS